MPKPFNWGIIGPGKIARKFVGDLLQIPDAKLHAVASRSEDRARSFASEFSVPHHFGSYEAILNCPDIDAIYIATPHVGHMEYSIQCLKAGIPVLCEKPLAINSAQVAKMIEAANENNTFLMEALWSRFLPSIKHSLELIEQGTIGKVLGVKADFGFMASFKPDSRLFDNQLGGGSLLDIGIYPVLLSLLILGKPKNIKAVGHIGSTNIDEECAILFTYDNDAMAQLHSTIRYRTKTEAFISGELGVIHLPTRWHESKKMSLIIEGKRPRDIHFDYPEKGYRFEIEEVMKCVRAGKKESSILPLSFSKDLMELLDAVRKEIGLIYPDYD